MAKMCEPVVVGILVRLLRSFDILVVQEVVDANGKAVHQLLEAVNSGLGGTGDTGELIFLEWSDPVSQNRKIFATPAMYSF
jgi:hypothetical protein